MAEKEQILNNTKAQMRKGVLELCILSIISEKEAYPSDILTRLRNGHLEIKEGTIYPLLTRLKNAGLLHYNWKESTSGPPRKYYHLTEMGRDFLGDLFNSWNELVNAVNQSTQNIADNE